VIVAIIAQKEIREMWRDGRFRWATGILLGLMLASLGVASWQYKNRAKLRVEAQGTQRDQWLNKTMANPHVAAHSGTILFRPFLPLSALDSGLDSYLGTSVYLEPHRRNLFSQPPVTSAPAGQRLAELTVAAVLQLLLPLLIFLLTFTTFAGEREQGTLRQTLSLGVKPLYIALGKIIGITAPLAVLLIPTTVVGISVLVLHGDVGSTSSNLPRALLMIPAYLVYFGIFLSLGLLVSAWSPSSQRSLIVLVGFWFVTCLLAPRVTVAVAQRLYPTPKVEEFVARLEQESDPVSFGEQRRQVEKRLLAKYGVQKAVDLPVSTWGVTLYEREEASTSLYNKHFDQLFGQYELQNKFYQKVSLFAPMLAVQSLSMGLAGSDVSHFRHFAEAAEGYRYNLVQTMNQIAVDSRLYNTSLAGPLDRPPFIDGERAAYERIPPFEYAPPGWEWVISRTAISVVSLLLWFLAVTTLLARALTRLRAE
jgi:ABC-2 type transport system permease protein